VKFDRSRELQAQARKFIPGGAHTYSKGDDQFPAMAPHSIVRGKGARVWDVDGNEFVDWQMGLTSVILGHAYPPVVDAVKQELQNGCNFIRPSVIELELARQLCSLIPSAQMVKFAKNGSDVTTASIKLARAFTGRDIVLRCFDQPFFSVHDWFMGNTLVNRGIPQVIQDLTKSFRYNNLGDLSARLQENHGQVACVILEPAATEEPQPGFLAGVKELCVRHGAVCIFDEVVSGFRQLARGRDTLYCNVTQELFEAVCLERFSIRRSIPVGESRVLYLLEKRS